MKRISAPLKAKVEIVCPTCGEAIEVSLEGLSNYKSEPPGDSTRKQTKPGRFSNHSK